jgi:hypothetical protein
MAEKKIYTSDPNKPTCGPCSYINLFGLNGNPQLEQKLHEEGRIKPFMISLYPSFFEWGEEHGTPVEAHVESQEINDKMLKLMFYYEKTSEKDKGSFATKAREYLSKMNQKYVSKIHSLENPIDKLSELLKKHERVAVLVSNGYRNKTPVPHWIVVYGQEEDKFNVMDSGSRENNGEIILTKDQLQKSFDQDRKLGFGVQLIVPVKNTKS